MEALKIALQEVSNEVGVDKRTLLNAIIDLIDECDYNESVEDLKEMVRTKLC